MRGQGLSLMPVTETRFDTGPLQVDEDEPDPADGSPISQVLRRLGALKGDHFDEFDAMGLGRHRDTDDWLSA
ncbi:hypothetical protein [Amycolatopsis japonica]|uniref:hypothetical protein n=1 Tax=Amycolatopsis japonica TaxID=208439 RepID=UPI003401F09F